MFNLSSKTAYTTIATGLIFGIGLNLVFQGIVTNQHQNPNTAMLSPPKSSIKSNTSQPSVISKNNQQTAGQNELYTVDSLETTIKKSIERLAAHPNDPQNAPHVKGVTDEQLAEHSQADIIEMFDLALPYIQNNQIESQYLFGLGRAAWLHNDEQLAEDLLQQASDLGSPAADAYLARMSEDLETTYEYLQSAVDGGFSPAEPWLKEVSKELAKIAEQKEAERLAALFDPNKFNQPELIQALYEGQTDKLNNNILNSLTYVASLHNFLADTNKVLFLVDDRNIIIEIDPTLSHKLGVKLSHNRTAMNQAANAGISSFWGMLQAMATTRQRGGSIMDEVQAVTNAAVDNPVTRIEVLKQQATQDAQRLAILYDSNPQAFRKVYAGIKKFAGE